MTRLEKTLAITPPGGPDDRVLEMGAYLQITPALKTQSRLRRSARLLFRAAGRDQPSLGDFGRRRDLRLRHRSVRCGERRFPYQDGYFSTVLCCELLEHLAGDPMHMMIEINRILKPGGHLVLTTPNIVSLRAVAGILQGFHPMLFPAYIRPNANGRTWTRATIANTRRARSTRCWRFPVSK